MHKGLAEAKPLLNLVGVRGFEPPTPSSRTKCATKLRYTPMSAGREFTESPDPTQAFFAFGRKKKCRSLNYSALFSSVYRAAASW